MTKKNLRKTNTKTPSTKVSLKKTPSLIGYLRRIRDYFVGVVVRIKTRCRNLLSRRPHRSFKRTLRRDYTRSLRLPGYWSFSNYVRGILWKNRRIFIYLALIYAFLTITLVGIASQDSYTQLGETIRETSQQIFKGNTEGLAEASVLMLTSVTGKLNNVTSEAQQIYGVLIGLLAWLTTVWLLRAITSGQKPKLRDALYSAGAPILPTFAIALVVVVQLLPIAVAVIAYAAANTSGLLEGGIETMLFWTFALLLGSMSLYWITSTLIALAIVTLPGMYPLRAVKAAGDIVIGRRIRILLRLLWMAFLIAIVWIIVMLPVVLFDSWLRGVVSGIEWLPLVPIAMLIMGTITVIWTASYIYLLYRKVVDDDAAPA